MKLTLENKWSWPLRTNEVDTWEQMKLTLENKWSWPLRTNEVDPWEQMNGEFYWITKCTTTGNFLPFFSSLLKYREEVAKPVLNPIDLQQTNEVVTWEQFCFFWYFREMWFKKITTFCIFHNYFKTSNFFSLH